ncbi:MAG: response regulator [Spirochaetes bacterium]|nr:MAG: response regulator [Spirochaetota bacterium]
MTIRRLTIEFINPLLILCFLAALSGSACNPGSSKTGKPMAVKGTIDLRGWNCERDGSINLDGEWEFYWDRVLEPSDFLNAAYQEGRRYINVPGLWKNQSINGAMLPGEGQCTYRMRMLYGPGEKAKTLTIHRIYAAYRLWINGVLADQRGMADGVLKDRKDYVYVHNKGNSTFTPLDGINEIIIQVTNSEFASGGIDRSVQLDDGEISSRRSFLNYTIDMIIVGLLLFSAIHNLIFYFFRKADAASLYMGLAGLVLAINTYNIHSPILSGGLSYPANPFLINFITVIFMPVLFFMTFKSLFPDDFSTRVVWIMQAIAAACLLPQFLFGFRIVERIIVFYFAVTLVLIMYGLYGSIKTIMEQRDDAVLFSIGFCSVYFTGINNVLYFLRVINTGNLLHYGMAVFCLSTTMVISRRFARALRNVETMSGELEAKNISLETLDRLKDQFLANTSHELRTPLHGMIGLSESMLAGAAGDLPPKARENLSLIASSGQSLSNMVNDILDMARIQDGGLSLNLRPIDLGVLCEMVVKLSLPLVGGKNLKLLNSVADDLPRALADEDRVRQVLNNLVGNAIKFTNTGTVEISARVVYGEDGDPGGSSFIEVSVSDTGIGVPDDYKEMIFEPYRQVDGSDTRSYSGTGLGLAIAKQIIELHGGRITVAPAEKGGSVFSFTLPASDDPSPLALDHVIIEGINEVQPAADAADLARLPAGINDTVFDGNPVFLVVDDDPVNVRVIQGYFESKRCVVKTAFDGLGALDILDQGDPIDLVLLDIMMPVMSGFEVCRRIREKRTPEELPVIMLTAKNMMSDIDAAFEAGANDYIVKPFRMSELVARVGTMLKLRHVRKSVAEGITIRDRNRAYSLKFVEIIYITSHAKSIVINTAEGDIEVPVLMKEIIHRLPPDIFIRIHKSYIINIHHIHSLSHVQSGRYRVRLRDTDDTNLPVGPVFLANLRNKM